MRPPTQPPSKSVYTDIKLHENSSEPIDVL